MKAWACFHVSRHSHVKNNSVVVYRQRAMREYLVHLQPLQQIMPCNCSGCHQGLTLGPQKVTTNNDKADQQSFCTTCRDDDHTDDACVATIVVGASLQSAACTGLACTQHGMCMAFCANMTECLSKTQHVSKIVHHGWLLQAAYLKQMQNRSACLPASLSRQP